jgi:RimJ/RimL family protein N-acetyltransferase
MQEVDTHRLHIVPLALEEAEALLHGQRPVDDHWAPDYPTDATLVAAGVVVTAAAEGRDLGPWTAYQVQRREDGMAIGGVGFSLGEPDREGRVRVTFSLVDSAAGHGFAAEAVHAMIDFAKRQPGVTRVLAETAETNPQGLCAFEHAGMRRAGAHDGLVSFEA